MQPGSDETADVAAGGSHSVLGPTALDGMLVWLQRTLPKLTQASDLLLIGAAALLALVDLIVWATDPVVDAGRLPWSIAFLVPCLGALATVAVGCRRRHRTVALATLAGTGVALTLTSWSVGTSLPPSFAALFALGLLTSAVLRHSPGRAAVMLTMVAALATAMESVRPMVVAAAYLLVFCEAAFGVAIGVGVYLRWSDWRRVIAAEAARADERLGIARELHDMVGHYVSGMVVRAQAASHVASHRPDAAAAALLSIEAAGTEALAAMRRMVSGLRDDSPAAPGVTWDDVDRLLAGAAAHGQAVQTSIEPEVRAAAAALVPSVHRIIAESLTNIRRHAKGVTRVEVALFRRDGCLVVSVHDDGQTASPCKHDGFGIVGMRERAESLRGTLRAGPASPGGWSVRAELPMEPTG